MYIHTRRRLFLDRICYTNGMHKAPRRCFATSDSIDILNVLIVLSIPVSPGSGIDGYRFEQVAYYRYQFHQGSVVSICIDMLIGKCPYHR